MTVLSRMSLDIRVVSAVVIYKDVQRNRTDSVIQTQTSKICGDYRRRKGKKTENEVKRRVNFKTVLVGWDFTKYSL